MLEHTAFTVSLLLLLLPVTEDDYNSIRYRCGNENVFQTIIKISTDEASDVNEDKDADLKRRMFLGMLMTMMMSMMSMMSMTTTLMTIVLIREDASAIPVRGRLRFSGGVPLRPEWALQYAPAEQRPSFLGDVAMSIS